MYGHVPSLVFTKSRMFYKLIRVRGAVHAIGPMFLFAKPLEPCCELLIVLCMRTRRITALNPTPLARWFVLAAQGRLFSSR